MAERNTNVVSDQQEKWLKIALLSLSALLLVIIAGMAILVHTSPAIAEQKISNVAEVPLDAIKDATAPIEEMEAQIEEEQKEIVEEDTSTEESYTEEYSYDSYD